MISFSILFIWLMGLHVAYSFFIAVRSKRVFNFIAQVRKWQFARNIELIEAQRYEELIDLYDKLPEVDVLIYGFKKLRLESFFSKEEIFMLKTPVSQWT